jgi:signal transduction histidine kinase
VNRNKTIKFLILAGTALIATAFLFAVITMYDNTLNDAKNNHQLQQLEMAKAATTSISFYLKSLVEDMYMLSNYPGVRKLDKKSIEQQTDYLYNHYDEKIVRSIFITNKNSNIIYSIGSQVPKWVVPDIENVGYSLNAISHNVKCWYSEVNPIERKSLSNGLAFVMLIPIGNDNANNNNVSKTKINGYVGFLIDFDLLMKQFIAPLKLNEGDFAWVMDGRGRLIYHPRHNEMLLHSIYKKTKECSSCHSSFDIQKKMLSGRSSFAEYKIGNEPTKVMAYAPLTLDNEKWILAVSTFLPKVTAALRSKFNVFFGLGIIILIVIFSFGFLLYFINARRIRAEDANRLSEERQYYQEQLNQAAKLASIGELVDNVAHEINTPLGIISSHADALILQKDYPKKYIEELSVIKNQTNRISKYTRSLLGYSKRMPFQPEPLSISPLIDECLYLLDPWIRAKKARVIKFYRENVPAVEVDRAQMEQVFVNLINNAIDAIDFHGQIKIETGLTTGENNNIFVRITDNGSGIDPENFKLIFEPFYTTKAASKGTGLGLSISKAIITRHHGNILVNSIPGQFTSFTVLVPLK